MPFLAYLERNINTLNTDTKNINLENLNLIRMI